MRFLIVITLAAIALTGCAQSLNNRPWGPAPTYEILASQVVVQVDQNGDFYPDNWQAEVGDVAIGKSRSIALALPIENRKERLEAFRQQGLDRVRRAVEGRNRVFVLIHGFNAEADSAAAGADIIKQIVEFTPQDAIIQFNWDGLRDRDSLSNGGVIWFPSTTTSQQAGERGLRSVLSELDGRKVVFVTHSRGASVVLSAFSNPNYLPHYERSSSGIVQLNPDEIDFNQRGIEADAIFLAPAIGEPDFWSSDCGDERGCLRFRAFPGLRSLRYTVNVGDPILQKRFLSWNPLSLPCRFNPTALGVGRCVDNLEAFYRRTAPALLQPHGMTPMGSHSYVCYAGHPVLRRMLAEVGVATRPNLLATSRPPVTCDASLSSPPQI